MGLTAWEQLSGLYPWPESRPSAKYTKRHGWLSRGTAELLRRAVTGADVVIELGSWLGLSARFMLSLNAGLRLVCIDHWEGDPGTRAANPDMTDGLYESFLHQCWDYRARIVPIRASTRDGLERCLAVGLSPQTIYVDASHDEQNVLADVLKAGVCFPGAVLVGDDWGKDGVTPGVEKAMAVLHRTATNNERAWISYPKEISP